MQDLDTPLSRLLRGSRGAGRAEEHVASSALFATAVLALSHDGDTRATDFAIRHATDTIMRALLIPGDGVGMRALGALAAIVELGSPAMASIALGESATLASSVITRDGTKVKGIDEPLRALALGLLVRWGAAYPAVPSLGATLLFFSRRGPLPPPASDEVVPGWTAIATARAAAHPSTAASASAPATAPAAAPPAALASGAVASLKRLQRDLVAACAAPDRETTPLLAHANLLAARVRRLSRALVGGGADEDEGAGEAAAEEEEAGARASRSPVQEDDEGEAFVWGADSDAEEEAGAGQGARALPPVGGQEEEEWAEVPPAHAGPLAVEEKGDEEGDEEGLGLDIGAALLAQADCRVPLGPPPAASSVGGAEGGGARRRARRRAERGSYGRDPRALWAVRAPPPGFQRRGGRAPRRDRRGAGAGSLLA